MRRHPFLHGRLRGVSLVEALVALAVMSIGMLALVGVQSTMRLNSDLAKQRTEATRIASEEIERVRTFLTMAPVNGQPNTSYDEIAARDVADYQPPDGIGNTSYQVARRINEPPGSRQKIISVEVRWTDRSGVAQQVVLDSAVSGTAPTLGAMLMVPARESATSRRNGRNISIPHDAVDRGDGTSRFVPPGSAGVAWYFNNLTGVLRVCSDASDVTVSSCPLATLVSGLVRYHMADEVLTGAAAEDPKGAAYNLDSGNRALTLVSGVGSPTADCYAVNRTTSELLTGPAIPYFCAVVTAASAGWGGQLNPQPVNAAGSLLNFSVDTSDLRSCRYTDDWPSVDNTSTTSINEGDALAEYTPNADHPRTYCMERPRNPSETGLSCTGKRVKVNLINQNFLIIRGNRACPTELSARGTRDTSQADVTRLILANTQPHQPASR